jgi:hypothetical protein
MYVTVKMQFLEKEKLYFDCGRLGFSERVIDGMKAAEV